MINLIHAEFYKLKKSTAIKICFLLSCVSAAALVYISHSIAVGSLDKSISGSASGLSEFVIISLLGSLVTGILICSDFETKTIHDSIVCGKGRSSIVISKIIIYVFVIILLEIPYAIATIIGFLTGLEFSEPFVASAFVKMLYDGTNYSISAATVGKIAAVSLVTMFVHVARLSICIPFAFKIRKPVAVLAFGFVFSAVIDLIFRLFADIPLLGDIVKYTPFNLDFVTMTINSEAGLMLKAMVCSAVFISLITMFTYKIFKRDEIK